MCIPTSENPNSYFGYVIQTPRALHYLLDGAKIVSIESKDDISVIGSDDKLIVVEQIKDKDTTFSNCSDDFWRTFANWINRYKENEDKFTNRTQFIIFSNRKQLLKKDSFIDICNNANNDTDSQKCIEIIKNEFSSKNPKIKKCFDVFNDEQNETIVVNIIRNFSYQTPNIGLFEDVKNKVQELHSENRDIEELRIKMLGWINEKIYDKETDKIRKFDLLQTDFRNYLDNNKNLKLALIDDVSEFDIEQAHKQYFYHQLSLIEREEELKQLDCRDYHRWLITRAKEEEKGKFSKKEFDDMYRTVYEKWLEDKDLVFSINNTESDVIKGKRLYNCSIENKFIKIGNTAFDNNHQEVARGVCNFLANNNHETQNYSIGWHPDYKRLLNEENNA